MGLYISQADSKFFICHENIPLVIDAIKDLINKPELMHGGQYINGKKTNSWFSFVDMNYIKSNSIKEIFDSWGFEIQQDVNENICKIQFMADKAGQEDILFKAIAPFVKNGSFIEFINENLLTVVSFEDNTVTFKTNGIW